MWDYLLRKLEHMQNKMHINFRLLAKVKKIIIEDHLQEIPDLETDLFPCLVDMSFVEWGSTWKSQKWSRLAYQEELSQEIKKSNIDSIWLQKYSQLFDKFGLEYSEPKRRTIIYKNFLNHPILYAEARKINKVEQLL